MSNIYDVYDVIDSSTQRASTESRKWLQERDVEQANDVIHDWLQEDLPEPHESASQSFYRWLHRASDVNPHADIMTALPYASTKPWREMVRLYGQADEPAVYFVTVPRSGRSQDITEIPNLRELADTINRALPILEWEDDWDGEGSPRFARATWERARDFILQNAKKAWLKFSGQIDAPAVGPGPNGAIDILWRDDIRKLIVTVPPDADKLATFYYENAAGENIEGTINLQDRSTKTQMFLMWLV